MAYDATKPVTGGSLVAADIRENFRALKEDDIVEAAIALTVPNLAITNAKVNDVAAGKITAGTFVSGVLVYDGTIVQAKLKTSTGTVSVAGGQGWLSRTLPGGEYGFYPQTWVSGGNGAASLGEAITNTSALTQISLYHAGIASYYIYASQRYVTASGEIHWIFILRDKTTKQIIGGWQAPDHPCFGNGGKPEIVQHPFGDYDPTKHEIIVINPSDEEVKEIMAKCEVESETEPDKDFLQIIQEEYEIDETTDVPWPDKEVTVGLPKYVKDKNNKKHSVDYRFLPPDMEVKPIKKKIPKPDYILCRKLKKK